MKYLKILMLPVLGMLFFTACDDDDPAFDGTADVFVMSRLGDDGVEYAPAYYVYANLGMKSAVVSSPDFEGTKELKSYGGFATTFALEPEDEDYQMMPPSPGDRTFDVVTNKDEQLMYSDKLESNVLSPTANIVTPVIENNQLIIEWEPVQNVEAWVIRMTDEAGENIIFGTQFLKADLDSIALPVRDMGLQSGITPQDGNTYVVEVQAYLFEDLANPGDGMNVQSVSTRKEPFVWETGN